MRSKVVRMLALAWLLCGVGIIVAQQPLGGQAGGLPPGSPATPRAQKQKAAPEKSKLEEMLAEALKNNPDIRVAAAKLAEAEAELNRTRVQVTQKIVALNAAIARQKAEVAYRQKEYERYKGLLADRAIDVKLVEEVHDKLTLAKAQLEELEAQMPALLGKSAHSEANAEAVRASAEYTLRLIDQPQNTIVLDRTRRVLLATRESADQHKATGPMAERLRKALQTPVTVDYKDMHFSAVLKDLEKKAPGLSFHIRDVPQEIRKDKSPGEEQLTLRFDTPLPIASVLQAITDTVGSHFYVRDYGILVTQVVKPIGALTVEELMRQKPAEK